MTPDDILAIAREGNPKVIAAILNRSIRSYGLLVRVSRDDRQLHVLLEGPPAIHQATMVSFVELSLKKLGIEGVETVKIYGRQTGQKSVAWSQAIALQPDSLSVTSSTPPTSPVTPSSESAFSQSPFSGFSPANYPQPDPPIAPPEDSVKQDADAVGQPTAASPETDPAPLPPEVAAPVELASPEASEPPESFPPPDTSEPPATAPPETPFMPEAAASDLAPLDRSAPVTTSAPPPVEYEASSPSAPAAEPGVQEVVPEMVVSDTLVAEDQGTFEHPDFPEAEAPQEVGIDPVAAPEAGPQSDLSPVVLPANSAADAEQVEDRAAAGNADNQKKSAIANPTPAAAEDASLVAASAPQNRADANQTDADSAQDREEAQLNFRTLLQRPEAVVLVLFLLAVYVWQFYESLMAEVAPTGSISGRALANRLQVSYSTIRRRRGTADFTAWSQSLDPDGIAWIYVNRVFVPSLGNLE